MLIADASVLVAVVLDDGSTGKRARERIRGEELAAPELMDLEVASVVRRQVLRGAVSVERGRAALADLADLPVERHGHRRLVDRCWALRDALTVYDASYVAVAEALSAPLLTADVRLSRAVGPRCPVEVFT